MLKLANHKHTFKLLPHHHTSFRGLFLVLLVLGVSLFSLQQAVHADFMDLNAKISGPIPTTGAVITAPVSGGIFSEPQLTIRGTCEELDPAAVIIIMIDDSFAGSAACQAGGTFSVPVTLPEGTHDLVARTSNATDDYGPDSAAVSVTYRPVKPSGAIPGNQPAGSTAGSTSKSTNDRGKAGSCPSPTAVRIISQDRYLYFGRLAAATWKFNIEGGCMPYRTVIAWGDGTSDSISINDHDTYEARHAYAEMKPTFDVSLTVISADGQKTTLHSVAITPYIPKLYNGGVLQAVQEPFILGFEGTILRLYLAYLVLLILVGLAWYDKHIKRLRVAGIHIFPKHPDA